MIIVAITGASGPIMGIRLIEELLKSGEAVSGIASNGSIGIMEYELSCFINSSSPLTRVLEERGNAAHLNNFREYDETHYRLVYS